jgi:hypothetical protein
MPAVNGRSLIARCQALARRWPWLLPTASFVAGWVGFLLVRRGADFARWIALLALVGWPWLLIEPLVRRPLERRREGMGKLVANFVSQSLQQELLFFSLPLLIGATQIDAGQIAFTGVAAGAALISTIDPVYERWVAARAARRLFFHAYCSWIAALVVLPMVLRLPLEHALPLSLAAVAASLLLTLPLSLRSLATRGQRALWTASVLVAPVLLWLARGELPAAGLAVTEARITQTVENLTPGPAVRRLTADRLADGVVAFAAIRAPAGLAQTVVFEWRHGQERERIVERLHGGRAEGFRLYSRKRVFPADAVGAWTVDLLTPQGQLLKRLRFVVEPAAAPPAPPAAPAESTRASPTPAAPPTAVGAAVPVAPCLAESPTECPAFLREPVASAAAACRDAGGTPVAAEPGAAWTFDVDGDGRLEYAFEPGDLLTCEGAYSLYECGSLGCPKSLYAETDGAWQAIGEIYAEAADAVALAAESHGGHRDLTVGCSAPCTERWHYVWSAGRYERAWLEVGGTRVELAGSVHGLFPAVADIEVRAAPAADAPVLSRYDAGTDFAIVGTARDADYYYVSPCNACTSGFVPKSALDTGAAR